MLSVSNLSSNYGNIRAVRHIDLEVPEGAVVGLIGANGSGKSTTMKTLAGHHKVAGGTITFEGTDVTSWPAHRKVRSGLAFVPERPTSIVAPLTVEENLALSSFAKRGEYEDLKAWAFELFPRLGERRTQAAGSMSGGEQQMLALSRGIMTNPSLLLIDSPAIGLAPSIVDQVYEALLGIHDQGVTMMIIEQNAALALVVCDYVYLLTKGPQAR